MKTLRKRCLAAAVAAVIPVAIGAAQAQSPSSGSSLYSPTDGKDAAAGAKPVEKAVEKAAEKAAAKPAAARSAAEKAAAEKAAAANRNRNTKAAAERKAVIPVAINGRWQDAACVPLGGASRSFHVQRLYDFDEKARTWRLTADLYGSDSCLPENRLFTYEGEGTYEITGRSRLGNNVYEAAFKMKSWQAQPASREGALAMFNARCGSGFFDAGRPIDLGRSGCSLVELLPLAVSDMGRDLVQLNDGKIFLGPNLAMPAQGDERPGRLSSYGLTRL